MLSFLNLIVCRLLKPSLKINKSRLKSSWFRVTKGNNVTVLETSVLKTRINIIGTGNIIEANECLISDTIITVQGTNNRITLKKGVKLRKANLIIRGNSCNILIDEETTFGGVRIINVGSDNTIAIGKNCLFSDYIEIWASDTHAIYDEQNNWINKEAPISIGDNVWVGSRVNILKGVTINSGAIIGLGSLVTKDTPEKVIAAGVPAKIIKQNVHWSLNYPNQ